jgi:Rab3 GTPase-activating protein catalytic subunit
MNEETSSMERVVVFKFCCLNSFAGSLSARMQIKGNMWLVVWEAAKPVPARRQKRLFDDTREAEKVLHFLESQKLSAVAQLLLPALTHAAICRLLREQKEDLSESESFRYIVKTGEKITRNPRPTPRQYIVSMIVNIILILSTSFPSYRCI